MPKAIQVQVPRPCHENWDQMSQTENGRFCLSCRKEVIDFSMMTSQQILHHISKVAAGVCGRFNSEQLNYDMVLKEENNLSWHKYLIHVMIPALLMTNKSTAQGKITGDTIVCSTPKGSSQRLTGKVAIKEETQKCEAIAIEGKVTDEKLQIIPGASVIIKGTNKGVSSDNKGHFKISIAGDVSKVTFVASAVGFAQKEFSIDPDKAKENVITTSVIMNEQSTMMLGEVVIVGAISKKKGNKTIIQSVKYSITNFFIEDTVRIYPNPVQKGSTFNIDFDVKNTGEYDMTIINISGKPLMQKKIFLNSSKHIEQIQCDDRMTPGIYFVQVVNLVNKKNCMNKILVE